MYDLVDKDYPYLLTYKNTEENTLVFGSILSQNLLVINLAIVTTCPNLLHVNREKKTEKSMYQALNIYFLDYIYFMSIFTITWALIMTFRLF